MNRTKTYNNSVEIKVMDEITLICERVVNCFK